MAVRQSLHSTMRGPWRSWLRRRQGSSLGRLSSRRPCPPDYVGIGAQRCGTSWWHSLIQQHPSIRPLGWGAKELHALDPLWDHASIMTADQYALEFRKRRDEVCGEWTPRYMWDPWAVPALLEFAPEVKLLVMLRDPVARLRSGIRHAAKGGAVTPDLATSAFERGLYGAQLARVLTYAKPEQVLVLQLERCVPEQQHFLDETFAFLGVDKHPVPGPSERNEARMPEIELSERFVRAAEGAYREDSRRLVELFPGSIDLSLWSAG